MNSQNSQVSRFAVLVACWLLIITQNRPLVVALQGRVGNEGLPAHFGYLVEHLMKVLEDGHFDEETIERAKKVHHHSALESRFLQHGPFVINAFAMVTHTWLAQEEEYGSADDFSTALGTLAAKHGLELTSPQTLVERGIEAFKELDVLGKNGETTGIDTARFIASWLEQPEAHAALRIQGVHPHALMERCLAILTDLGNLAFDREEVAASKVLEMISYALDEHIPS